MPCGLSVTAVVEDDAERDQVGEAHADERVVLDAPQVLGTCSGVAQRSCARPRRRAAILDLLRRLPEEQIRADRRAEHRDDRGDVALRRPARNAGGSTTPAPPSPRDADRRAPRRHRRTARASAISGRAHARVREEDLQRDADDAEADHVSGAGRRPGACNASPIAAEVGGDVDRVGERPAGRPATPSASAGSSAPMLSASPWPRGAADARRDHLDADHQRIGQEQRPDQRDSRIAPRPANRWRCRRDRRRRRR